MTTALLAADHDPKAAADHVLANLVNICQPQVKGAHDSSLIIIDGKAFIAHMANDVQPGEAANWPFIYDALAIVDVASGQLEETQIIAAGEMAFANETLPEGACFVPRLSRLNDRTLRCFFASENPGKREAQTWRRDFDVPTRTWADTIHRVLIETSLGVFPMQPKRLWEDAAAQGYDRPPQDFGLYMIDGFKSFDGCLYTVLNNFPGGQTAFARLDPAQERMTVLGHFFRPLAGKFTEAAFTRLPNGDWCAISRQENRDCNCLFATSADGREWTEHQAWDVAPSGSNSKTVFECFGGVYYLGWQDAARINGVHRSVFNLAVSRDARTWERKYRFETEQSFQYPTLHEYDGAIYLTVTQGDHSASRKERIMFGRLESLTPAPRP